MDATIHFKSIFDFLYDNNLFSTYGREIYRSGIDSDTSLTSGMVSNIGMIILDKHYDNMLKNLKFGEEPDLSSFTKELEKIKNLGLKKDRTVKLRY
jgi:hypothetical protein